MGAAINELLAREVVLFDLDGTLVDSSPAHEAAFVETLRGVSSELASSFDYGKVRGQKTKDVFDALGLHDPSLIDEKQRRYREAVARGVVRFFDGAVPLLTLLAGAGRRLGVVTGASRPSTEAVLASEGVHRFFETVVTGDDVEHGKPDPAGYRAALIALACAPDHAYSVEDASSGVVAAKAAGLLVVGVGDELPANEVDVHFTSIQSMHDAAALALRGAA